MRVLFSSTGITAVIAFSITLSAGQSPNQEPKKEPTGSVSGRVTLNGKPVQRAVVVLGSTTPTAPQRSPAVKATTDEDGRYKATRVAPGTYQVMPYTPAWIVPAQSSFGQPGKTITLGEGEEVEDIDFSLTRGGVITGRVSDADGKPVIGQRINLLRTDDRGQRVPIGYALQTLDTDDRGVYRLFGLPAGSYKVSVGDAPNSGMVRIGFGGGTYPLTFYPGVPDESRATTIEVSAGNEATGIDIVVGRAVRTYSASGRIVDADTGRPMPNLRYGYGPLIPNQPMIGGFGYTDNRTNSNGEFRIEGIAPGRYGTFAVTQEEVEFYSEAAVFDIFDSDVTGLEIRVRRGSTMTGTVVIEGSADAAVAGPLSNLQLRASVRPEDPSAMFAPAPIAATTRVGADGSFRVAGLRPGKVMLFIGNYPPPQGLALLRLERDGVEQREGIVIGQGEAVSGVRVVMGYGTAVLRGQVNVVPGQVSADVRLLVGVRLLSGGNNQGRSATPDARGRFVIEWLIPGEYEVSVRAMYPISPTRGDLPPAGGPPAPIRVAPKLLATQNVTVANGAEAQVVINVDLTKPANER